MQNENENLDHCPVADTSLVEEQVPIIDVGELIADSSSPLAAAAIDQIAEACKTWGFFQIVNHGIGTEQVRDLWQQTQEFFKLSTEAKLEVERSKDNPWGFFNRELTKNQLDKKEVFDFTRPGIDPIYQRSNRWPSIPAGFRPTMETYLESCTHLSLRLLEGFCRGLDLPATYLHPQFERNHTGFIRLNYYPVESGSEEHVAESSLGVHHHTDAGALTVLLQDDIGGLQVLHQGCWHDIPSTDGALVVNTGDMMQVWSNDFYKAAIHRVLAMDSKDRYSIPFFFNPSESSRVEPLPSVVNESNPQHYDPIVWGEYRGKRSDGDFADYGAEVQISQFRR